MLDNQPFLIDSTRFFHNAIARLEFNLLFKYWLRTITIRYETLPLKRGQPQYVRGQRHVLWSPSSRIKMKWLGINGHPPWDNQQVNRRKFFFILFKNLIYWLARVHIKWVKLMRKCMFFKRFILLDIEEQRHGSFLSNQEWFIFFLNN